MKKIILIIFFIPLLLKAQIKEDAVNHFTAGFIIGGIANMQSYQFLKDTNLKTWQSKTISLIAGIGIGAFAGHLKEIYDENNNKYYNKSDFNSTLCGAIGGSVTIRLIIGKSIPKSKIKTL